MTPSSHTAKAGVDLTIASAFFFGRMEFLPPPTAG